MRGAGAEASAGLTLGGTDSGFPLAEAFHPLLRTESQRLLGRAQAALGDHAAACEAAERAAEEAARSRYVWLEMLSLRDLLEWSEADAAEGVRARLSGAVARIAASAEELEAALG